MTDPSRVPYRVEPTHHAAEIVEAYAGIADGEETGVVVTVAGRLMLQRPHGRLAFAVLRDLTGDVQLFSLEKATADYAELIALPLGTWVRATGEVVKTRKGELSVKVADWEVLARPVRPFPDKWHGLHDPDTRYRQRYVDTWVTPEARAALLARSQDRLPLPPVAGGSGVHRGRDPDLPPDPGRGAGQTVLHPPQRAGPGALPPHRP